MIEEVRNILEGIENISIQHNFWEANSLVDIMANEVIGLWEHRVWEMDFLE